MARRTAQLEEAGRVHVVLSTHCRTAPGGPGGRVTLCCPHRPTHTMNHLAPGAVCEVAGDKLPREQRGGTLAVVDGNVAGVEELDVAEHAAEHRGVKSSE